MKAKTCIITSGRSGVERSAWDAAIVAGHPTAGWMPRGFMADDGPHPEFARDYGAWEHETAHPGRVTAANATLARVLLWIGDRHTREARCAVLAARVHGARLFHQPYGAPGRMHVPSYLGRILREERPDYLWIAGNPASFEPSTAAWAREFVRSLLASLVAWPGEITFGELYGYAGTRDI